MPHKHYHAELNSLKRVAQATTTTIIVPAAKEFHIKDFLEHDYKHENNTAVDFKDVSQRESFIFGWWKTAKMCDYVS